jgi:hypothetical protein
VGVELEGEARRGVPKAVLDHPRMLWGSDVTANVRHGEPTPRPPLP